MKKYEFIMRRSTIKRKEYLYSVNYFIEILHFLTFVLIFVLQLLKIIDQQSFILISLFLIGSVVLKVLASTYLNFILTVRNINYFPDNRTANFMTFDVLKFILILIAIVTVIILGLNKVLNNETIATLLGGLIGSLITMKGSYTDLRPLTKDESKQLGGEKL